MTRTIGIVPEPPPSDGFGPGLPGFARQLWWERRTRTRFFPAELFGEPAWDLLLKIHGAEAAPAGPILSRKAHLAAAVPPPTARRWILELVALGILVEERRGGSPALTLAPEARERMTKLLGLVLLQRERAAAAPDDRAARQARITSVAAQLAACLDELDALDLSEPGAHLSLALATLERGESGP